MSDQTDRTASREDLRSGESEAAEALFDFLLDRSSEDGVKDGPQVVKHLPMCFFILDEPFSLCSAWDFQEERSRFQGGHD